MTLLVASLSLNLNSCISQILNKKSNLKHPILSFETTACLIKGEKENISVRQQPKHEINLTWFTVLVDCLCPNIFVFCYTRKEYKETLLALLRHDLSQIEYWKLLNCFPFRHLLLSTIYWYYKSVQAFIRTVHKQFQRDFDEKKHELSR